MKIALFFLVANLANLGILGDIVTLNNGDQYQGRAELRERYLKMETHQGRKLLYWRKVKSFLAYPPHPFHKAKKKKELTALFQKKFERARLQSPGRLYQLGRWCERQNLPQKAKEAYQAALRLNSDHRGARKKLGYIKDRGKWRKAKEVFEEKFAKIDKKKKSEIYRLDRWCKRKDLPEAREKLIRIILRKNRYDRKAIKIFRELTSDYTPKRNYIFPLKGRFKILVDRTRHHQRKCFAIWAYDIVKLDEFDRQKERHATNNEDYHIWNEPVYSVGDGEVVFVADNFKDNRPGTGGKFEEANKILIDHGGGEYSFYCHLKEGSAVVKKGDKVKAGQMIGRIGNSGASGIPHLHFTMMDKDYFSIPVWFRNYKIQIEDEKIAVKIARPEEGWVVRSQFKKYFAKSGKDGK